MNPTVGRIVHYVARGSADGTFPPVCRAAVIAEVRSDDPTVCALVVLNPSGIFFDWSVQREDDHMGGTWHWPERNE